MADRIETIEGLFGEKIHYKNGKKIGESWPGFFGGSYDHYDAEGHKVGRSDVGLFSDYDHYNTKGEHTGYSQRGVFGGMDHYNEDGFMGHTRNTLFGEETIIE